jgi:hypothetical protein
MWLAFGNGKVEWLKCTITSQCERIEEAEYGKQRLKEAS